MKKFNINNNRKLIFIASLFILLLLIGGTCLFLNINKNKSIDKVLESSSYEYLPKEAKNYIKKVYEETGEVLLTEKNKKENFPYLNPNYVDYLVGEQEESEYGYVPLDTIIDYDYEDTSIEEELPSRFNLQDVDGKSYVTSMKNQGSLGLCWDFAATGALESKIIKSGLYKGDTELDLSERQVDYATTYDSFVDIGFNPYSNSSKKLGSGGNIREYLEPIMNGISPVLESDWHYDYYYIGTVKPEDVWNTEKIKYDVEGLYNFSMSYSEEKIKAIKKSILDNGTAVISFGTGRSSSYKPTGEEKILVEGKTNNILYYGGGINHEVQIIGWDDNYRHNICTAGNLEPTYSEEDGTYTCTSGKLKEVNGAWIMKNSWGEKSASAYAYIPYDNPGSEYSIFTDVNVKNWDNVYNNTTTLKTTYKKTTKKEKLEKIKFYVQKNDVIANVYVSTTGLEKDYVLVGKKDIIYSGLYTLDLSDKNIILDNENFSVKITNEEDGSLPIYSTLGISAFTKNVDDKIEINIDDAKNESFLKYHKLAEENNIIVLNGTSRGLTNDKKIDFVIKDENGIDITNKFTIFRNYEVGNYINSILSFENDVPFGTYNVSAFVDDVKYDDFKLEINCYTPDLNGKGTIDNPFIITNADELNLIRTAPNSYYKLGNDIDLSYDTRNINGKYYNEGSGWKPIYSFKGGLDGDGHKITGLYINRPAGNNQGLFTSIASTNDVYNNVGEISTIYLKNIIIEDFEIITYSGGALVGYVNCTYNTKSNLTLENIIVKNGVITATNNVGGIASSIEVLNKKTLANKKINNLYNDATVISSSGQAGGLFSYITTPRDTDELNVSNLINRGMVISNGTSGGLFGSIKVNDNGLINVSNGFNYGNIKGNISNEILGKVENSFGSSSSTGKVTLNNFYYLKGMPYSLTEKRLTATNVELKNITELKDINSYSSWEGFSDNFEIKEIDGITRVPILKGVDFKFTEDISDITLYKDFDTSIYNYILPNIDAARNISYSISDESVASIDEDGNIIGKEKGSTTLHVLSYYDGYEKDVNINVVESPLYYKIKYDANGGAGSVLEQAIEVGVSTKLRSNLFSRDDYVFKEWNTKPDGTGTSYLEGAEVLNIAEQDKSITLYAIWIPAIYNVKFDPNGGTGTMGPQQIFINKNTSLNANTFEKEKSIFIGWNTKPDESGDWYDDEEEVLNLAKPTETITLYAIWDQIYTVLFDANDGTGNIKEQEFSYNYEDNLNSNTFRRTGYLFKEWNTKPDGTGTSYKNRETVLNLAEPEEKITLYAIWQINSIDNLDGYELLDNYILNIEQKTMLKDYLSKIKLKTNYSMKVYNLDGEELSDEDYITTGSITKIIYRDKVISEIYNIVLGDINGDGLVTITDVSKLFSHIDDNGYEIKEDYYLKASDTNKDGNITITDISKLFAYIINNILSLI